MARYRNDLPQLRGGLFLNDGCIETRWPQDDAEKPYFAAFVLPQDLQRCALIRTRYSRSVELAKTNGVGLIVETPTWRANSDWGERLGYSRPQLEQANRDAVALLEAIRANEADLQLVISGCLGPRGDGHAMAEPMSAAQAHDYHAAQIEVLADTEADMLCAQALDHCEEAIGIAQAAEHAQMPVAIGFSVDASGHLPGGLALREAIEQVDAQTERYPLYYLINCTHPNHAQQALLGDPGPWRERLRGLRVSALTHIEPDSAAVPGNGDPEVLASHYVQLRQQMDHLNIFGNGEANPHLSAIVRVLRAMP